LLVQAGDVAFEMPMSLVVTLERVLGDESIGEFAAGSGSVTWSVYGRGSRQF
jgi:hypothetical protein